MIYVRLFLKNKKVFDKNSFFLELLFYYLCCLIFFVLGLNFSLLYLFMFAMPITGWLVTSAAGVPVSFFGLFVLPNLISANESYRVLFANIHAWIA